MQPDSMTVAPRFGMHPPVRSNMERMHRACIRTAAGGCSGRINTALPVTASTPDPVAVWNPNAFAEAMVRPTTTEEEER